MTHVLPYCKTRYVEMINVLCYLLTDKRLSVINEYEKGGLKMIDLETD